MQLTPTELTALAHGAVRTVQNGEFTAFYRFTEQQDEYYRAISPDFFHVRAQASANIRIELLTDARELSFDFRAKQASARSFFSFDVAVDGKVSACYLREGLTADEGHLSFPLPAGEHRVTLYLPNTFSAELAHVTLAGATSVKPVTRSRKMLILGDSVTQGMDAHCCANSYANKIADLLDATAVNQGIGGEIFRPAILDGNIGFTPDIVTVAYGTNDYSKRDDSEIFVREATAFYRGVRNLFPTAKIFGILPIWRGDANAKPRPMGKSFEEAKEIVRAAAETVGAAVIDGDGLVPHSPYCFDDGKLHPNDLGFDHYAKNLFAAMEQYLK